MTGFVGRGPQKLVTRIWALQVLGSRFWAPGFGHSNDWWVPKYQNALLSYLPKRLT